MSEGHVGTFGPGRQCSTNAGRAGELRCTVPDMVTLLKHRLALAALVGVLLIPLLTSNTGGLSHLLFCRTAVAQPFAIGSAGTDDDPEVTSSTSISRDDPELPAFAGDATVTPECDGVRAEVSAEPIDASRVALTVSIINGSEVPWRGSIGLDADGVPGGANLTAVIGEVPPGETGSTTVEVLVQPDQTEIQGTLLLGQ